MDHDKDQTRQPMSRQYQRPSQMPIRPLEYISATSGGTQEPTQTLQISEEAPWDKQGEDLLCVWLADSKQQAVTHRKRGFRLKKLYKFFGVLSIFSAAIVFFLSNIVVSDNVQTDTTVKVFVAFINLIIANLASFLEYGPKYRLQFEFEGKYTKLSIDISELLALDPDFRPPKDRVLAEYKEKIGNLFINAPEA